MGFFSELRRRHVFRAAGAYLLLAWLVLQVTDTLISVLELPAGIGPIVFYILVVGFPLAVLASWIFEITPEGIRRESEIDSTSVQATSTGRAMDFVIIAALTVVVGFLVWERIAPEGAGQQSIAVLPVRSIDGDDTSILFATGLHDILLVELATGANLDVIARQSVLGFADSTMSIGEIAALLGVTHIVDASVQKVGNQLRVSAQLIEARSDKPLWGDTYDEAIGFDNFFQVQSEIVARISVSLKTKLLPAREFGSQNADAVRDYLAAIQEFHETCALCGDVESLLESAVEKDPEFALAWVRLADVYQQKYWFMFDQFGVSARDQAEEALARARALQPELPELHLVQAKIRYHGYLDHEGALAELELAEEAMPGSAEVFFWRGAVQRHAGNPQMALVAFQRSKELDPRDGGSVIAVGTALLSARRYKEAQAYFEQAVSESPDPARLQRALGEVYWFRDGDTSVSIAALDDETIASSPQHRLGLIDAAWRGGQLDLALKHALEIEPDGSSTGDGSSRFLVAFILQAAGREDEARPLFEQEAKDLADMLVVDPNGVLKLNHAARVAMAMGDKDLATRYVHRLVDIAEGREEFVRPHPRFGIHELPFLYGPTLCQMGELDAARDVFREVLQSATPFTVVSLVRYWPPCREQFEGTPQYEELLQEFGHLSDG